MPLRLALVLLVAVSPALAQPQPSHRKNAPTPPMGWNSWDCFGTTITEEQARAQADAMAKYLKPYGWTYFTVDIQWYEPDAQGHSYRRGARLEMDEHSRLMPGLKKFPSSSEGRGFKPLADYVHAQGLKFGIHIMRGIARQAVRDNTPILGADARAADIANTRSFCSWNPDMWGVDMSKPGAQEYYDSLFQLYASWGVDFVKVDDISRPHDENQKAEIEAIRKAIDKCGRPVVLSLSPGDTPIERGEHVMNHANMWRISDDFWDRWPPLYEMFGRLDKWTRYRAAGAWPDADMLPFGIVEFNRPTRFTQQEQTLCMTLWCIARSPLILGADLTRMDEFTLSLLINNEVLAVSQDSINNRQFSRDNDLLVWTADMPGGKDKYVAFFNAQSNDDPFDLSKADYRSRPLRGEPKREVIEIKVPVNNARRLVLAIGDGGNGNSYDHAAWIEPTISGSAGAQKQFGYSVNGYDVGGKADPARLVFCAPEGNGINVSLMDMGNRFRMTANPCTVVLANSELPNLPVARVLWKPEPDLKTAAAAWILGGGAHHTGFSMALTKEHLADFAEIAGIEHLWIDEDTTIPQLKQDSGRFIRENRDCLWLGPPGTGKSHLCQAIGYQAIRLGFLVLHRSIFDVVRDFVEDEAFAGQDRILLKYLKPDLLIIDDTGIKQLPKRSGEYLFEIIMRRYETKSTMMTSNRPLEDWGKLVGDVPAATAILDRFLHHAEILTITGRSCRLKDKAAKDTDKPKEPTKDDPDKAAK